MFEAMERLSHRPRPYEFYTARDLWNHKHVSKKMLALHLDEGVDLASRNKAFVCRSIDWMASRFNIEKGTRICDFGCGPGLYTTPFAEMGADVTGIDFSERSIRHARKTAEQKILEIDYQLQDYLQFTTRKKFHLLTMIFLDLCALSPSQRKTLFSRFDECLENDGRILLDVLSLVHFDRTREEATYAYSSGDGFWSPEPYYVFVNTFKYENEKVILDKHTVIEKTGSREIYNWLQCYSLESLGRELHENGFRVVEHYSDVAGTPYQTESREIAVVVERR